MAPASLSDQSAALRAFVEDRFFSTVTDQLAASADGIGVEIQSVLTQLLKGFFASLAAKLNGLDEPFEEIRPIVGGSWIPLGLEYEKYRKFGQTDYFVYSELPILRRRTYRSRKLRRTTIGLKRDRTESLRNQMKRINNFAELYGAVIVNLESHTTINRGGRRQYKAGTLREGVRVGGQITRKSSDFVSIVVDWVPNLTGQDVLVRGVTEEKLNPRIKRKLLNSQDAYRPLIGAYLLFYQNTTVRDIILGTLRKYGGAP